MACLSCAFLLLVSLHLIKVVRTGEADWGTTPDPFVYTCLGQTVNLTWALAGSRGADDVDSIRWFHRAASGPELVAAASYGQFFSGQTYAGRVSQLLTSGISLTDVRSRDEGNYSIEIIVRQGNQQLVPFTHSVALEVGDSLMTKDGRLKVKQDTAALWNATSKSWMVHLLCGQFFFQGRAPVDVEWILPTGEIKTNSTYDGGNFYLSLDPATVVDGNYTCRIPPNYYSVVCLTERNASSITITSATIVVDEVRIRLTLAEAEQRRLNKENKELQTALVNLTAEVQNKIQDLTKTTEELSRKNIPGCGRDAYDVLDDQERDVNHTITDDPFTCLADTGVRRWYRMFLGGHDAVIPTTCIPGFHCGTKAAGWLDMQNKSLPRLGEDLDTRVCFHYPGSSCCYTDNAVTVRNCGSFFLYRLELKVRHCFYNYCLQRKYR